MAGPPPDTSAADRPPLAGADGQSLQDEQGFLLSPYRTFVAVWNAINRTYRYTFDEAIKDDPEKARQMDRDLSIGELLQERYLAVASLPWHLEPDNPKNTGQKKVADDLTAILKATPKFAHQTMNLLEGIWFGKSGSQQVYGEKEVQGQVRQCILKHAHVHGDKIQWDYDGNPLVYVYPAWAGEMRAKQPELAAKLLVGGDRVTFGDRAPMLRLADPAWRERFVIHQHLCRDSDYFESEKAGGHGGVGLRDKVYWFWWMKNELLAWALSYMEKVGANGILLFYYQDGNKEAKAQAEAAAASSATKTAFAVPVPPGGTKAQAGAEVIPASTQGTEQLHDIIANYFERHIERYIVGQSMSSGADTDGSLGGSGKARFAQDTKWQITKFDAENLAETRTEQQVRPLQRLNFPDAKFPVYLKYDVPDPEAEAKLSAAKQIVDMGIPVKVDEVRAAARLSKPLPDDEVVQMSTEQVDFDEAGNPTGQPPAREVKRAGHEQSDE
jgi:phage gp29-like protein